MTRVAWFALVPATLLCAQETGEVAWDPKYRDGPITVWQMLPGLAIFAVALFAYRRAAAWFVGQRRERPRWKSLRYSWPTLMVGIGGLTVLLENWLRNNFGEWAFGIFLGAAVFLHAPAAPTFVLLGLTVGKTGLTGWSVAAILVPSVWTTWYGIIRFLEWRSFAAARQTTTGPRA